MSSYLTIPKKKNFLIFDALSFRDLSGAAALHEDDDARSRIKTSVPIPPDPNGLYQTDYINLFLPTSPDPNEAQDAVAVKIMRNIMLPSQELNDALSKSARFAEVLAGSKRTEMQGTRPDQRHSVFLNGISAATALVTQEHRIRGAVLAKLFSHVNESVADCVAALLHVSLGTNMGVKASRQLLGVPGYGQLDFETTKMVDRLARKYADFKIYHAALTALKPDIAASVEIRPRKIGPGNNSGPPGSS